VNDLSYDGCEISCDDVFQVGEQVRLSVIARGAIRAHVRWTEKGKLGLRFGLPEEPPPPVFERVVERTLSEATVHVRRRGGKGFKVPVFDASPEGCRVGDVDRYQVDEPIWVRFPGLEPIETRLCWRGEVAAGLRFVKAVHPAVFDLLLTRLRFSAS
jgi:hypothetical protein